MRVLVALGTRPEIVKLAPVVAALRGTGIDVDLIATGQHPDAALAGDFFASFGLEPDEQWLLEGDDARRVGTILERAFRVVDERKPDTVLVLGDTYTVPLFCLAARRHRVPVVHLEAGLRSFNPTSMEEVNRRTAAALASLHLAPTEMAAAFLQREGIDPARIRVVGNPVIDVLVSSGIDRVAPARRSGVLVTAHRATNVDDPARLAALVDLLVRLHDVVGPVTFPVHPRTQQRLTDAGLVDDLVSAGIGLLPPMAWEEMLATMARSELVVTDSGGLQEEASFFGVPVVVLRRSTPRWEGVANGTSVLVGMDVEGGLDAAKRLTTAEAKERIAAVPCPYGDGDTSERVARMLADPATAPLLAIVEPDLLDGPVLP